jgi:hypothetical protein
LCRFSRIFYVADYGNDIIRKISPQGITSTFVSDISGPMGICLDKEENIFVTLKRDIHGIVRISLDGTNVERVSDDWNVEIDGKLDKYWQRDPCSLCFDSEGDLLIASSAYFGVFRVNLESGIGAFVIDDIRSLCYNRNELIGKLFL